MSDHEKWLPVVGFESLYEVSNHGRVRSFPRVTKIGYGKTRTLAAREMKPYPLPAGHLYINLTPLEGKEFMRRSYVHALVLEAFVGPRPEGYDACHNDGDPANNHVANLRWDTRSANMHDRVMHGNHPLASRDVCKFGHPLDGVSYKPDGSFQQRFCRKCGNARMRRRYHELKAQRAAKPGA